MYVSQKRYKKRAISALIGLIILTAIVAVLVIVLALESETSDGQARSDLSGRIALLVIACALWVMGLAVLIVNLVRCVHWAKIASIMTPMVGEVVGQDDEKIVVPYYYYRRSLFSWLIRPKLHSSICIRFKIGSYYTPYLFTKGEAEWFTGKRAHCCIINKTLYVMRIEGSGE